MYFVISKMPFFFKNFLVIVGVEMYVKQTGFIQIDLYIIIKEMDDPYSQIPEELTSDLVTTLAKYGVVTDGLLLFFEDDCEKCEKKDILHKSLIEAGKRIATENLLADQKKQ